MIISPAFQNFASNAQRVSFQFSASGNKGCGIYYVTMNVEGDLMDMAKKAAKQAMKRAGATEVELCNIVNPVR